MVSPLPPVRTGESIYTFQLIEQIAKNSDIKITAITNPEAAELPSHKNQVKTLRIWDGRSLRYPLVLWKRIIIEKPDIVHVQFGPHGEVYGGFFGEVMLVLLLMLRMSGIRTTITLHSTWIGNQVKERIETYQRLKKISFLAVPMFRLYMKLLEWGTSFTQLSTAKVNSTLKEAFLRDYSFPSQKIGEIPHPCQAVEVVPDAITAKRDLSLMGKRVILIFGYIRRGKGIELAIEAMRRIIEVHHDAKLLIVGRPLDSDSEAYLSELLELVKEMNLEDSIQFVSRFIPDDEIRRYFSAADVILMPYTESIGASGPIHNYAGYGRPIVASDVGYHMKETLDGALALFAHKSATSLAQVLCDVLDDKERMDDMSQRNVAYSKRENWQLAARRTVEFYQRMIELN